MADPGVPVPLQEQPVKVEPKARYRRIVDHYECPLCGKTLGELSLDRNGNRVQNLYIDIGPTYHWKTVIADGYRTFKPCGCSTPIPAPPEGNGG